MFEKLRAQVALSLLPKAVKATNFRPYDLMSFQTAGQPVYTEMTSQKAVREGYKLSVYVYRSVRTIVQAVSGIPWLALDKNNEPIEKHPFTEKWAKPNKQFSGQDNMEFIIAHLKLVGNALIQPVIVNGIPEEFWVCMPDMIKPIPSRRPGEWIEGWKITTSQGITYDAPPEQFIHFMQFDPGNPYWGIGDLLAAARTVDTDNEAQDTQKLQLQNRGVPPSVFQFENKLTDAQYDEAVRRVREKFLEKSKRGEPWVLGGGYTWQSMALTPVEMDYIKSRIQNLRDIAGAFGLDPYHLGDTEHSIYNNVNEANKAVYTKAGIPLLDDIRSTLNLKVAPLYPDKPYITYDLSNVSALRDDFHKRVETAKKLWEMAVPFDQINDRLELGFEEFPGWDKGYLTFNLIPAEEAGEIEPDKSTDEKAEKSLNLSTEEQKDAHWKRVDRRRVAWWGVVSKRVLPLYEAESRAIQKALLKSSISGAINDAQLAIDAGKDDWLKILKASSLAVVQDFGADIASLMGAGKWEFDPLSISIQTWVADHAAEQVATILETNLADVRKVIAKGAAEKLTVSQISSRLRDFYTDRSTYKAMRVARTEVTMSAGYGQREAAKQSGAVKTHTWISSRDSRVRDSHASIDGQTRPINERFSNGLLYPGDSAGAPEEVIQCRCVESYGTEV